LGGVNEYGGLVEERARLGDLDGPLLPSLIPLALQLTGLASFLLAVMFLIMVVVW
jgi:hypothetical protein